MKLRIYYREELKGKPRWAWPMKSEIIELDLNERQFNAVRAGHFEIIKI